MKTKTVRWTLEDEAQSIAFSVTRLQHEKRMRLYHESHLCKVHFISAKFEVS